jgi:hypothetical protein
LADEAKIAAMALFGRPSEEDNRKAHAWAQWIRKRHPLAIVSFVLGVFSLIEFGAIFLFGIAGAVVGAIALMQLKRAREPGPTHGHWLAVIGIVCSLASVVVAALFTYRWI